MEKQLFLKNRAISQTTIYLNKIDPLTEAEPCQTVSIHKGATAIQLSSPRGNKYINNQSINQYYNQVRKRALIFCIVLFLSVCGLNFCGPVQITLVLLLCEKIDMKEEIKFWEHQT